MKIIFFCEIVYKKIYYFLNLKRPRRDAGPQRDVTVCGYRYFFCQPAFGKKPFYIYGYYTLKNPFDKYGYLSSS